LSFEKSIDVYITIIREKTFFEKRKFQSQELLLNRPDNEGMLFVFSEKVYGIAFLDSDGEILKILDMEPCIDEFN
jgi:uncharacterized membrane protein (UPF0127 family)